MYPRQYLRLWLIATICLFLASCAKNKLEQPAPASTSSGTDQQTVQALQELFNQKKYDQLVNPLPSTGTLTVKWEPEWSAASWSTGVERYVDIPLQAKAATRAVSVKNLVKYLRFQQVKGTWKGTMRSYFYKLPKGNISNQAAPTLATLSLSSFTGEVFTKDLETHETLHSSYANGAWQRPAVKGAAAKTASCKTYYYCHWYITCDSSCPCGPQPTGDYYTYGEQCDEPRDYTTCGYWTRYSLMEQTPDYVCDVPDDPNPGPNNPNHLFADGIYTFKNYDSNLFLAVQNNSIAQYATAIQNFYDLDVPGSTERWQLTFNNADGSYTIAPVNSGLVLDVQWGSSAMGTPLWLYPANGTVAQKFDINRLQNDYGANRFILSTRNPDAYGYYGAIIEASGQSKYSGASIVTASGHYLGGLWVISPAP